MEGAVKKILGKRQRQSYEENWRKARSHVADHYKRLQAKYDEADKKRDSKDEKRYLPSLAAFRNLPVIQLLQNSSKTDSGAKVGTELKSQTIRRLVENELKELEAKATKALNKTLGQGDWESMKPYLAPSKRLTARFMCPHCKNADLEKRYLTDGCLDFAGAYAHDCPKEPHANNPYKRRKPEDWGADRFAVDQKVSPLPL
jgi:hypothetical protein